MGAPRPYPQRPRNDGSCTWVEVISWRRGDRRAHPGEPADTLHSLQMATNAYLQRLYAASAKDIQVQPMTGIDNLAVLVTYKSDEEI